MNGVVMTNKTGMKAMTTKRPTLKTKRTMFKRGMGVEHERLTLKQGARGFKAARMVWLGVNQTKLALKSWVGCK
jgi:hypothetical protein